MEALQVVGVRLQELPIAQLAVTRAAPCGETHRNIMLSIFLLLILLSLHHTTAVGVVPQELSV